MQCCLVSGFVNVPQLLDSTLKMPWDKAFRMHNNIEFSGHETRPVQKGSVTNVKLPMQCYIFFIESILPSSLIEIVKRPFLTDALW